MLNELYLIADQLDYVQRGRVRAQVRESHLERNSKTCDFTKASQEKFSGLEDWLNAELAERVKAHPAHGWFSRVKGIGDVNIGKVIGLIDIEKASQVSKLWRYAGFGCNGDGKAERRQAGEKLHFNMTLKVMCWRLAKSLIRAKGAYYAYYLGQKAKLAEREQTNGRVIVPSAELPKVKGKHVENDEFVGLGHVDMMAMRKMTKLFLSHLWVEWRKAEGLEITEPYAQGILGHSSYLDPWEFIEKPRKP